MTVTVRSVSYTHLDVYKRQGFYRTGKMFAFMNFDMKPDIITFAKGVTCGYVQLGGCIVSKKAVSYTHLDVYKRQVYFIA